MKRFSRSLALVSIAAMVAELVPAAALAQVSPSPAQRPGAVFSLAPAKVPFTSPPKLLGAGADVVGRHIFYNNSFFDGNSAIANVNDDKAIAPHTPKIGGHGPHPTNKDEPTKELGKDALRVASGSGSTGSGSTGSGKGLFASVTSFDKGINGIMVDIANLPATGVTAADFFFRTLANACTWASAPAPSSITIRRGAGVNASDRITIIWPDQSIRNVWLEVTVLPTVRTGLKTADVFLFGNLVGEGNGDLTVTSADELLPRTYPHNFLNVAAVADPYDHNKDKYVTVTDELLARNNNDRKLPSPQCKPAPTPSDRAFQYADTNSDKTMTNVEAANALVRFGKAFGTKDAAADFDLSGTVDFGDLSILAAVLNQSNAPIVKAFQFANIDVKGDAHSIAVQANAAVDRFGQALKSQDLSADFDGNKKVDFGDLSYLAAVLDAVGYKAVCGNGVVEASRGETCDDGNTVSGDGCSAICKKEALAATLNIAVKATSAANKAVANQKNIPLLRFETSAQNQDVLLTGTTFEAAEGSLINAQNYSLWVDTDGNGSVDTIVQNGVFAQGGKVKFDKLAGGGYVIPKTGTIATLEVHADVASSLSGTQAILRLKFATALSNYVVAEEVNNGNSLTGIKTDGVCAGTCQITVTTVPSTLWTFVRSGNLYVTKSPTPIRPRQLLGGTIGDEILRVRLRAEYEDINVTGMVFTAIDQNASDMIRNVSRLELYRPGETTPFASAYAAACGTSIRIGNSFCVLMHGLPLVVQKNTVTEILVRPRMNTDADGAVSGQNLRLTINRDSGFDPSGNTVTAQGVSSSNVLTFNNGNNIAEGEVMIGKDDASANYDITGNSNTVVLSKIATVTNADPHPNGSMIPMGPGADIGQFKFTAAANNNFQNGPNKVALGTVLFSVNASNVLVKGDSFKGFRSSDSTSVVLCYPMGANGSALSGDVTGVFFVSCAFSGSPVNNIIDGGTDATFGLRADILNAKINSTDSVLQVSLTNFADSLQASFGPAASHLSWRDQDNGGSTVFWWIESPVTTVNGTTYVQ